MKTKLRLRFVAIMFSVMFTAGVMASCITGVLLNGRVGRNLHENQRKIADRMLELAANTNYTTDEIIALCIHDPYGAERTGRVGEEGIAFVRGGFFTQSETRLSVHGEGVRIYVVASKPAIMSLFFGVLLTAAAAVVLGTAFAGAVSQKTFSPINELIDAIEKVAQGDFSVRVHVPHSKGLYKLMASFNRMAEDLAGLESLRTDFINDVSHEFRTPLASINGFAKLLQDPDLAVEERIEYTKVIECETKRLASLASDILTMSRLENQTIITNREWFPLDEELRQAVLMLAPTFGKKGVEVTAELPVLRYYGSAELLRPVWRNLLDNAIKFTPEGGQVSVRLIDAENEVIVRVKDTGIGMNAQTMAHIFEKFYQGDASHAREGAGLGLALAKRVIDLCGGEITVRSEPGQGSAFNVKLPVVRPTAKV